MTGLQDSQWQRQFVAPCCHHAVPAGPPGLDRGSSGRWVEPDDSGYCVSVFVGGRGGENMNTYGTTRYSCRQLLQSFLHSAGVHWVASFPGSPICTVSDEKLGGGLGTRLPTEQKPHHGRVP